MNGNGVTNGKFFKGRFSRVDDMILKIGAGVTTAVLIATIFFGMKVYAFMAEGERYTEKQHLEQSTKVIDDAWKAARLEFVHTDVYERDREYLDKRLDRMEAKIDQLLEK